MSSTMTIRLGGGIKNRLDQLASVTQRSKSFLAAEAIAAYVDTNEWQLAEIQAGLSTGALNRPVAFACRRPTTLWHHKGQRREDWQGGTPSA